VAHNEPSRRSQRAIRSAISEDYEVYVSKEIQMEGDPTSFEEAMRSDHSSKWLEAMEDEMWSMSTNRVWDMKEIPKWGKIVDCKWVYKMKCDSKGNIERFKARLVAKGFTQREGIDYTETFSTVSFEDSLRIIMTLVVHYDLELHQMDVKTTLLNGDLLENIYMAEPKGFVMKGKKHIRCHLKKSIYGLKQASRQWYLKFDETIRNFGFKENEEDNCIYAKFRSEKFIFLILYVDDILLVSCDVSLLLETKRFLSSNFDMKDFGEASLILGIEIHWYRRNGVLGLSQKAYLENVLKKFSMHACNPTLAPIVKGDKYGSFQSPKNQYEIDQMKSVLYASAVGSLIYAQVYTRLDLAFVIGMLSRYQKNPGIDHWNGIKRILRYIQGTKGIMLTYERSDSIEIVGYSDLDFVGCLDTDRSTLGYIFKLTRGPISWSRFKQTVITSSTMYAEFVACYEATR
jgi:hypothetical protein